MTNTDTKNPDAERQRAADAFNIYMDCDGEAFSVETASIIRAALSQSQPPDQGQIEALFIAIKNAEAFNRRECFADSQDGMKAFIEFGTLLDIAARYSELARGKGGV